MRAEPLQTSFAAGEVSRRLRGRSDSPLYAAGLSLCENFQPLSQGPLLMRGPFDYIDESNFAAPIRLIPFRANGFPDFIVALGNLKLQIFSPAGRVIFGGTNLVTNGDFASGLTGWTYFYASATYGYARINIHRYYDAMENEWIEDQGWIYQTVAIAAPGDYRITFNQGGTASCVATVDGIEVHSGDVVTLAAGNRTIEFDNTGSYPHYVTIDNVVLEAASSNLDIVTPWTGLQLPDIQYVSETGKDRMLLVHPNVEPRVLTRNADGTWTFAAPAWTNKPGTWVGTNWPGVIEIHKGRSWWGGVPDDRNKVWASCARGNLFDFSTSAPQVASDTIAMDMATRGAIRWFKGRRNLLVGTDEGEHAFLAQNSVLTPTDIESDDESDHGSAKKMAVRAGNRVLYLSADQRKVRAIGFDLAQQSWTTRDLTWAAEHITDGLVDELHFAKEPIPTIVALVAGELRLCTFDEAGGVAAWWRLTTDGTILSVATSNGAEGSSVWIAVERTGGLYIERTWLPEIGTRYTLDAAKTVAADANGLLSGLAHLNGETVQVIVNDILVKDAQAVAGGQIDLGVDYANVTATVGLPVATKKAVLLPRNPKGGKVRAARIGVHLNNSALPKIGTMKETWRPAERDASTPWDSPTTRASGKTEVRVTGWDEDGEIVIEQDLPFRTEILAVYAVVSREEA